MGLKYTNPLWLNRLGIRLWFMPPRVRFFCSPIPFHIKTFQIITTVLTFGLLTSVSIKLSQCCKIITVHSGLFTSVSSTITIATNAIVLWMPNWSRWIRFFIFMNVIKLIILRKERFFYICICVFFFFFFFSN